MTTARRTQLLAGAVIALAVSTGGCGGSDSPPAAAQEDRAAAPRGAILFVQGVYREKRTQATGVVFEPTQGLVLTANHAMENAPRIDVRLADGTLTHARQVARAQCHDMAVLRLGPKPRGLQAVRLGRSAGLTVGEPVSTHAYLLRANAGDRPALTRVEGTVSAVDVRTKFPPLPATGPFIAHQTPLVASAAGSPVIDGRGRMIGLNTLVGHPRDPKVPGIEYALTSDYISKRLAQLRPGGGGALAGWRDEHNACHDTLHRLIRRGHLRVPHSAP